MQQNLCKLTVTKPTSNFFFIHMSCVEALRPVQVNYMHNNYMKTGLIGQKNWKYRSLDKICSISHYSLRSMDQDVAGFLRIIIITIFFVLLEYRWNQTWQVSTGCRGFWEGNACLFKNGVHFSGLYSLCFFMNAPTNDSQLNLFISMLIKETPQVGSPESIFPNDHIWMYTDQVHLLKF